MWATCRPSNTTMDATQLKRWQSDIVAWAEANVHVHHPERGLSPLRLEPHQKAALREATKRKRDGGFAYQTAVFSWPRREGKTLCVALILCWRLATRLSQRSLILANSEQQAKSNIFALVSDIMTMSPNLRELVPPGNAQETKLTVPALDNQIECIACNWRTLQGRPRTDALAVDELHAALNTRAWEFATQQTEARDAQILVSSQAGAPVDSNPMYTMYKASQEGAAPHLYFDYASEHRTAWGKALADRERATLLQVLWDYQHRNTWGQTGTAVLGTAEITAAAMPWAEPESADEWREMLRRWRLPDPLIGLGLDRAGISTTGDRSVVSTVARWDLPGGLLFALVRCAVLPTGAESEVLQAVRVSASIFGQPARIYLEAYQCADLEHKIGGARLQHATIQRQQDLFPPLFHALRDGRFVYPESAGVNPTTGTPGLFKSELLSFEADVTGPAENVRWGTQRGHDDTMYSAGWAMCAAREARAERKGPNIPGVPGIHRLEPGAWDRYEMDAAEWDRQKAALPERLAEIHARMRGELDDVDDMERIPVMTSQGVVLGTRRKHR